MTNLIHLKLYLFLSKLNIKLTLGVEGFTKIEGRGMAIFAPPSMDPPLLYSVFIM
jgi:hypothetical protein